MLRRHAIADADWDRIKDLLPGRPGQTGWLAKDNRLLPLQELLDRIRRNALDKDRRRNSTVLNPLPA